jgi:hypothetical protein
MSSLRHLPKSLVILNTITGAYLEVLEHVKKKHKKKNKIDSNVSEMDGSCSKLASVLKIIGGLFTTGVFKLGSAEVLQWVPEYFFFLGG